MIAREEVRRMLSEPVNLARAREQTTFPEQLSRGDGSVVLYGAGRLGVQCARLLQSNNVPLAAWCDRAVHLNGRVVDGRRICAPEEAAVRYGRNSLFIVAIWSGVAAESMMSRVEYLKRLGCRWVVPFSALLWALGDQVLPFYTCDLPSRTLAYAGQLNRLLDQLSDEASIETLRCELGRRLQGEFGDETAAADQYFPIDLVRLSEQEVLLDLGAYTGDTLTDFVKKSCGIFESYWAFEPDPDNYAQLLRTIHSLPSHFQSRIQARPWAIAERSEARTFVSGQGAVSHFERDGVLMVPSFRLDDIEMTRLPTFIKIDIEGGEQACLAGGTEALRRAQPSVAICVYHRAEDLWALPSRLFGVLHNHTYHLRTHGLDGWETVFYALRR